MKYRVVWEVFMDADSPREAAEKTRDLAKEDLEYGGFAFRVGYADTFKEGTVGKYRLIPVEPIRKEGKDFSKNLGDVVKTTRKFSCLAGTIPAGSWVTIVGVNSRRGYSIRSYQRSIEIQEIGWTI